MVNMLNMQGSDSLADRPSKIGPSRYLYSVSSQVLTSPKHRRDVYTGKQLINTPLAGNVPAQERPNDRHVWMQRTMIAGPARRMSN
eukprot:6213257-Pleurochrysis_carterae.AAC.2